MEKKNYLIILLKKYFSNRPIVITYIHKSKPTKKRIGIKIFKTKKKLLKIKRKIKK